MNFLTSNKMVILGISELQCSVERLAKGISYSFCQFHMGLIRSKRVQMQQLAKKVADIYERVQVWARSKSEQLRERIDRKVDLRNIPYPSQNWAPAPPLMIHPGNKWSQLTRNFSGYRDLLIKPSIVESKNSMTSLLKKKPSSLFSPHIKISPHPLVLWLNVCWQN